MFTPDATKAHYFRWVRLVDDFGLAPVKLEGQRVDYDPGMVAVRVPYPKMYQQWVAFGRALHAGQRRLAELRAGPQNRRVTTMPVRVLYPPRPYPTEE